MGLGIESVPQFRQLFDEYGRGPQPWLTRLLLTPGLLAGLAALGSAAVVAAFLAPVSRAGRRVLLGAAVLLPLLLVALFRVGVYLPVFSLSHEVQ